MIGALVVKELTELRRDGRVRFVAALIALLAGVSLLTGWSSHIEHERQVGAAERSDAVTFEMQGEKPPHSAAHFGRLAHKPAPPLSVFDPGAAPYLGQVVWLEAHRQGPAMFRPAEDAPELRRMADLSVAGVLAVLVPLLIFLAGHGAFAGERERGTLRQVMSTGLDMRRLYAGKLASLTTFGVGLCFVAIALSTAVALSTSQDVSPLDTLWRSAGLVFGHALYSVAFASMALFVSARAGSARGALLILLCVWAVSILIVPRVAASVAKSAHPTPDSGSFWRDTSKRVRASRPSRDSAELRQMERVVLSRVLGRPVTDEDVDSLPIDRIGLRLEVGEMLEAAAFADAHRKLYATYDEQSTVRRVFSLLSPAIALQRVSGALAGTDIQAHRHFVLETERQRRLVVRAMNEDMMLNAAGRRDYVAGEGLWSRVPRFEYAGPSVRHAFGSASLDLGVLALWAAGATWIAWRSARSQSAL